ncbi:phenylalanine--tRNA ligase subunit alpha [Candidatus Falkowbacteria bacterium CG_4_9_14_3_um_filter_36_9]|uniref:Phenylalanine--tRNA ligase alpha subunit n=2 Tax=Candidatus Falkowiibacteriota TaxID=1752728 RepID=A0A1J4T7G6_9BACT|nr:MAG: phenylalanine--tRNA ligase subunit alpha [Candidatus Falkowbacteria bacterium CG1_02_37_44]PIV51747.1 MAG: phenylalanine--tRNA ligase subunit alpha [Candidatus Falkowbacteria bacterium CG02_land_8_20_14_3_00_36_14]PIX11001.1 MAG: phenylalanine--tRNA ligase subunit alpha [Candidatus Falkowbacteria bacterium CG_4_8_14_3_um_filter_36_11]PJA10736.1 MAG: phenylalanine--tRNA ligase subunit alpha [Candidatus Falkowbacteria bacterium CG_4_10_14_0_2_um_filter_36_22]PJB19029.1 MAG: phenylalanine-
MKDKLKKIQQEILNQIAKIKNIDSLCDLEIKYLGRKGELTKILRMIADLSVKEKAAIGTLANNIKREIQKEISRKKDILSSSLKSGTKTDVTLPGGKIARGHIHPITQVQNDLEDLFSSLGFMVLDGPELESDYYNFGALNIPAFHPARDIQDTFYIDKKNEAGKYDLVMRTHTSPVQIRAMKEFGAPLRCVAPGRTFRSEAIDASHEHTFYQLEGLMISEDISLTNLLAVLKEMLSGIFDRPVNIRVRPGYFPFVEPGLEIDVNCTICGGKGCPSCKGSGWLEMLGAGMVHPNVLTAGGIDPDKFSGFAFGLGINRLVMMKYGIKDIRLFQSGDLRFLEQF